LRLASLESFPKSVSTFKRGFFVLSFLSPTFSVLFSLFLDLLIFLLSLLEALATFSFSILVAVALLAPRRFRVFTEEVFLFTRFATPRKDTRGTRRPVLFNEPDEVFEDEDDVGLVLPDFLVGSRDTAFFISFRLLANPTNTSDISKNSCVYNLSLAMSLRY
jgi:hypothetical protein